MREYIIHSRSSSTHGGSGINRTRKSVDIPTELHATYSLLRDEGPNLSDLDGRLRSGNVSTRESALFELRVLQALRSVNPVRCEFQSAVGNSVPDISIRYEYLGCHLCYYVEAMRLQPMYEAHRPNNDDVVREYLMDILIEDWSILVNRKACREEDGLRGPIRRKDLERELRRMIKDAMQAKESYAESLLRIVDANRHITDFEVYLQHNPGVRHAVGFGAWGGEAPSVNDIRKKIKEKRHQHMQIQPLIVALSSNDNQARDVEGALYGDTTGVSLDPLVISGDVTSVEESTAMFFGRRNNGLWDSWHTETEQPPNPRAVMWFERQSEPVMYLPPTMHSIWLRPLIERFETRYADGSRVRTLTPAGDIPEGQW